MSDPHARIVVTKGNEMKITKATLRSIVKNARCSDCGTANPDAMAIVNETIICANCHMAKAFA